MQTFLQEIANTADAVFAVDSKQLIILWSKTAQELLGFNETEALGKLCCDLIQSSGESGERFCRQNCLIINSVSRNRPVTNYYAYAHTKSGNGRWLNISIVTLHKLDDSPIIVHFCRDATLVKNTEQFAKEVIASIDKLRRIRKPGSPEIRKSDLTQREYEILRLLAEGWRTEVISDRLSLSKTTVRNHIQRILQKLNAHSRVEAVAYAHEHSLI